ncbi:E3.1.11.2 [Mytilus coruscus]|uniref:exodeoxyribonuclease III n=1 Tax=Mytilus coruscus TaxID=42192 RepID=A0A6J8DZ81_MYTCO|nr:E3.1.11.2 [Mytilus coruscus]
MSLKIASINVNGLRNNKKIALVFNWIVSQNIDLVCLQETHCTHDETGLWNREWKENGGGESFWNCGTNDSRGVGILSRKDFTHCFDISMIDNNGRIQIGEIKTNTAVYHIIYLYTPNTGSDRKHFFENLKNLNDLYADDSTDHYNVFLGDFNCALDRKLDRAPSHQNEDTGLKELKSLLLKFELDDIWRSKFPTNRSYSFQRGNSKSRIYYIFCTKFLSCKISNTSIFTFPFSDHDIVTSKIKLNDIERGPGMWIMNLNTIKTDEFSNAFKTFWENWVTSKDRFDSIQE